MLCRRPGSVVEPGKPWHVETWRRERGPALVRVTRSEPYETGSSKSYAYHLLCREQARLFHLAPFHSATPGPGTPSSSYAKKLPSRK